MTLNPTDPAFLAVAGNRPRWTFFNTDTAAWYSAADSSTITASGGLASDWHERKGNGINLTATTTQRPTVVSNAQNGRSVMRFNGTTNYMTALSAGLLRGVSGATIAAVVRRTANSASTVNVMGITTSANTTRANIAYRAAGLGEGVAAGGRRVVADSFQSLGTSPFSSAFTIVVAVFDYSAATLTLYENGTQTSFRVFQTAGVTDNDAGALYVGSAVTAASFFNGDIAELGIFHSAVGTTLRQQAEGYLGHEWAINGDLAAGHPFRTFPPYQ